MGSTKVQDALLAARSTPVPVDVASDPSIAMVSAGAQIVGATATAVTSLHVDEHQRRRSVGLRAVTSLTVLDLCLTLPEGVRITESALTASERAVAAQVATGVVDRDEGAVIRRLRPPVSVHAAIVRSQSWRAGMTKAALFTPVCQRIILLSSTPRDLNSKLWEAQLAGVGVWVEGRGGIEEVLAPEVHVVKVVKAARWRFQERAYNQWLIRGSRPGRPSDSADRPLQQALEVCDRPAPKRR